MVRPTPTENFGPTTEISISGHVIRFDTPNEVTTHRAKTMHAREPETLAWIDTFAPDDVFYDVGANVGVFTLYAAKVRGARVLAFEPESQNYGILNRNIFLNHLGDRISAFCVGLSDTREITHLQLSHFVTGWAMHHVGEPPPEDRHRRFRQGCLSLPLDEFVASAGVAPPKHLKIDVDGIESLVVAGAKETLRLPSLRSLLIEVDTKADAATLGMIEAAGFQRSGESTRDTGEVRNFIFQKA